MPTENARRDELAIALNHVLLMRGITAPSMSSLAKSVGISRASLYLYFRNKEDIVTAVVARHLRFIDINPVPTAFTPAQFPKVLLDLLLLVGSTTDIFLHDLAAAYPQQSQELTHAYAARDAAWRHYLEEAKTSRYLTPDARIDFLLFHMKHSVQAILEASMRHDLTLGDATAYIQALVPTLLRGMVTEQAPALKLLAAQEPYERRILEEFRETYGRE